MWRRCYLASSPKWLVVRPGIGSAILCGSCLTPNGRDGFPEYDEIGFLLSDLGDEWRILFAVGTWRFACRVVVNRGQPHFASWWRLGLRKFNLTPSLRLNQSARESTSGFEVSSRGVWRVNS